MELLQLQAFADELEKLADHPLERLLQRTSLDPGAAGRLRAALDELNVQHSAAVQKMPKEMWLKTPRGEFATISRVGGGAPGVDRLALTTMLAPEMKPRGVEFTPQVLRKALGTPRVKPQNPIQRLRKQFGLSMKKTQKLMGDPRAHAAIGVSKHRARKLVRAVEPYLMRGLKIASADPLALRVARVVNIEV